MVRRYDALVIGVGMAGLPMALRAGRHGTALIERDLLVTFDRSGRFEQDGPAGSQVVINTGPAASDRSSGYVL